MPGPASFATSSALVIPSPIRPENNTDKPGAHAGRFRQGHPSSSEFYATPDPVAKKSGIMRKARHGCARNLYNHDMGKLARMLNSAVDNKKSGMPPELTIPLVSATSIMAPPELPGLSAAEISTAAPVLPATPVPNDPAAAAPNEEVRQEPASLAGPDRTGEPSRTPLPMAGTPLSEAERKEVTAHVNAILRLYLTGTESRDVDHPQFQRKRTKKLWSVIRENIIARPGAPRGCSAKSDPLLRACATRGTTAFTVE